MTSNNNSEFGGTDRAGGNPTALFKYSHAIDKKLRVGAMLHGLVPTSPQGKGLKPSALAVSGAAIASYRLTSEVLLASNLGYKVDRSGDLFKRDITEAQQFAAGVAEVNSMTYGVGASYMRGLPRKMVKNVVVGGFAEIAGDYAPGVSGSANPLRASVGAKTLLLEQSLLEVAIGADLRLAGAPSDGREYPGVPPWQAFARVIGRFDPLGMRPPPPIDPIDLEIDTDKDGFLDPTDRCPEEAEDKNGYEDDDGCPDEATYDRDRDGVVGDDEKCPEELEDKDDFEDNDGCPDLDNDVDGVIDEDDKCPGEKETINGVTDWDGCPDEGVGQTEYVENVKIEIKATILFEPSRATLKDQSKPLLDQVALQILAHPEVKKVRIEGHTDSSGSEADNLALSQGRAEAVRTYIMSKGVKAERLDAVGFGESRPIHDNATLDGRSKNRRVEFVITD
jgi:outer membrane protein OmpA-like peptidoglycan-associated protein